jgi:hypothetical protein
MKKALFISGLLALAGTAQAALTTVLDDFSGSLSNWNTTVILNNSTAPFNTAALAINSGQLSFSTSSYDGIEQAAHIFNNRSLAIGEELQLDLSSDILGSQDIGLYVGITPTAVTGAGSARASYVAIYKRFDEEVFSRGFAGTTEYALARTNSANATTTLFIARTAADTFEAGYYSAVDATRTVLTTRTDATNTAVAIGIYTDVRAAGTLSGVDNFRIYDAAAVPEPSSFAALAGLVGLGFAATRRRRG